MRKWWKSTPSGLICLIIVVAMFCYMGSIMGTSHMFNTIMNTAHDLLLNTVFYLMAICVLTGAIGKIFVEFGVVDLLEKLLRPLMRPLFNLPGVAALGAVMTFLSDNPAIITLSRDAHFSSFFKKYQFISLTNFGTAFGMGLIVIIFMIGQGFTIEPFIGLAGAFVGSIISTRLMQYFILKKYPHYAEEDATTGPEEKQQDTLVKPVEHAQSKSLFVRILNSLLDGGRSGVDIGVAIIPGVLIISTFVMILTFGPSTDGTYTGAAYEGTQTLPWLASQLDFVFEALFGFTDSRKGCEFLHRGFVDVDLADRDGEPVVFRGGETPDEGPLVHRRHLVEIGGGGAGEVPAFRRMSDIFIGHLPAADVVVPARFEGEFAQPFLPDRLDERLAARDASGL